MKNKEHRFESKEIILTPVSPIHISNGNPEYGESDIYLERDNLLCVIDEERLAEILREKRLVEDYVKFVIDKRNEEDTFFKLTEQSYERLKKEGLTEDIVSQLKERLKDQEFQGKNKFLNAIEKSIGQKHTHESAILKNAQKYKKNTFEKFVKEKFETNITKEWLESHKLIATHYTVFGKDFFIRNGQKKPYIPGSSIKGAIRTAIVWKMLQEYDIKSYIDELKNCPEWNKKNRGSLLFKELRKLLFEDYSISYPTQILPDGKIKKEKVENEGSHTDFMKCLLIEDSQEINVNKQSIKCNYSATTYML